MPRSLKYGIALALLLGSSLGAPSQARKKARANEPFYVAFVPGQDQVVAARRGGSLLLLGLPGLEVVHEYRDDAGAWLERAMLSPDGRWLAAGYAGGGFLVWDVRTGEEQLRFPGTPGADPPVFVFHPVEDLVYVFCEEDGLRPWDLLRGSAGERVRQVRKVTRISLSPDGRYLLADNYFYDLEEQLPLEWSDVSFEEPFVSSAPLHQLQGESADGRWRVSLSTDDGRLHLLAPAENRGVGYGFRLVKSVELPR